MKIDAKKMFSVPLEAIRVDINTPFPVFIYLRQNDRFIPIHLQDKPLSEERYQSFVRKNIATVWIPTNFYDAYQKYSLPEEDKTPLAQSLAEALAMDQAPTTASVKLPIKELKSEEAQIVKEVYEEEDLSQEDKKRILSAVSQDLLRSLNQITDRGEDARKEGLKRCKQIADEILMVASQNSNIYDEILALRNSQEEIEHSVIVGTIAIMFSLAINLIDEKLLADLTIASLFHDIGLVKIKDDVLYKKENSWSAADRKEYETHVQVSLDLLQESKAEFHPRVFRIISEHHENYDGSGFPKKLKGLQIDELSQIMHLANLFDRLCLGKQTGIKLSPAEAFNYIYETSSNPSAVQEVQPELVRRIFQFMLAEKEAAATMHEIASQRVKEASSNIQNND